MATRALLAGAQTQNLAAPLSRATFLLNRPGLKQQADTSGIKQLEAVQEDRISELELRRKRRAALARRNKLGVASLLSGSAEGLSPTLG